LEAAAWGDAWVWTQLDSPLAAPNDAVWSSVYVVYKPPAWVGRGGTPTPRVGAC
jgi:hypothetical protein